MLRIIYLSLLVAVAAPITGGAEGLVVEMASKRSVKLRVPKGTEMLKENLANTTLYYTRFPKAEERVQDRRKKTFLSLFEDEVEPYTGRKLEKSKCINKIESQGVWFFSGEGANWSGCNFASSGPKSVRLWKSCGGDLWEVTIQNIETFTDKIELRCTNAKS